MKRATVEEESSGRQLSRRRLLAMGAGATSAVLGVSGLTGPAVAWKRFGVDFRGCHEARIHVHEDDLRFDPPAVAHVLVAIDGDVACRVVECTASVATSVPDRNDEAVVSYEAAGDETILGVIEYNYRDDRFSEPVCLLHNDNACATDADVPDVRQADCVQAGKAGHWDGEIRECWFDPMDGQRPGGDPGDDDDDDDDPDGDGLVQTLTAPDRSDGDGFGTGLQVSKDGSVLLIGAPGGTIDGVQSGVVYVFRYGDGEWTQTGQIAPDDGTDDARFGTAVDLTASGDVAIVGAPRADVDGGGHGAAYLFERDGSTWTQSDRLVGRAFFEGDPEYNVSRFGTDVALDDSAETAVVGAPYSSAIGLGSGLSIAYERDGDGWTTGTELVRIGAGDSQQFGTTVDVAAGGDRAVAGAPVPFPGTTNSEGYVGVYPMETDWEPETFLQYSEGREGDTFGRDASCNDACDVVLAGDPGNNEGSTPQRPGRVVSFVRSDGTWSEEAVVEAPDGVPEDRFGTAVETTPAGTRALVSAPGSGASPDSYEPAVYALVGGDGHWTEVGTFLPPTAATGDAFGTEIGLDAQGRSAFVGAPETTVDGRDAGVVYVFEITD